MLKTLSKHIQRSTLPPFIKIVEVGPRDGLQNEKTVVPYRSKIRLIELLSNTGITSIEATSFVSTNKIVQFIDNEQIVKYFKNFKDIAYPVLTPNLRGYEEAIAAGASHVAVFSAASEEFSRRNTNCSISEGLRRFHPILENAKKDNVKVRGYVSCVLGCPYEGIIPAHKVEYISKELLNMGCYEISLGDTIGVGTPGTTLKLLDYLLSSGIPPDKLACHFHDTYGQALANICTSILLQIHTFDSSIGGLGGCPYAKGATGNVATEDLVYMLAGLGVETGVKMNELLKASKYIVTGLGLPLQSKAAKALLAKESCSE